jgi:hypothetical protein
MNRFVLVCFGAALLLGCSHSQSGAKPDRGTGDFIATGEMEFNQGTGASFNADRVVGSTSEVRRGEDGSWRGKILDSPVHVEITPDGLKGATLTMSIQRSAGGVVMTGLWQQSQILRFEYNKDKLIVRTPAHSLDFVRRGNGSFETESVLCRGGLSLFGEAANPDPPNPQFALALIATFLPRSQTLCQATLLSSISRELPGAEMPW